MKAILILATFGLAASPPSAFAQQAFEFVYADTMNVQLCEGCGIGVSSYGSVMLVNVGDTAIPMGDLHDLNVSATSSVDDVRFAVLHGAIEQTAPIMPNEAVGSVTPANDMFLDWLEPGETLRNTTPDQVFSFGIIRDPATTYVGAVSFDVTIRLRATILAQYRVVANMTLGDPELTFTSANRTQADQTTAVEPVTWGRIKQMYR